MLPEAESDTTAYQPSPPISEAELLEAIERHRPVQKVASDYLRSVTAWLDARYLAGKPIRPLIHDRATLLDQLLRVLWQFVGLQCDANSALIAVGGYGRGELHPHSDIDLLILVESDQPSGAQRDSIEEYLTLLWDCGLTVGHSVRTVAQCRELAEEDLSVATNLMESRLISGSAELLNELNKLVGHDAIWPGRAFFVGKREEQILRHRRFAGSEYNLEPNLKSCPGGLRDIQVIGWVAKRHFETRTIHELVDQGFLTEGEYEALIEGQDFLWRLRYGLHMLAERAEDRLLFEYQKQLAALFGFKDDERGLAIEHFMKQYYRWAFTLGELNEMLTQLLDEAILRACEPETLYLINRRFRVRNGYIEVCNDRVFEHAPHALIEIFVQLAQHEFIEGLRASTIRLIRQSRHLIDDKLRGSKRANQLFLKLLGSQHNVATQLQRMHRYGVLELFIPEFGRIIGQMQHDLFHVYTVDAHTLKVVKNLRRLLYDEENRENFPVAAHAMRRIERVELVYLAALFHDIAKGRGGNHSELGAIDAKNFCLRLSLEDHEAALVSWLVKNHLVMSTTAQKRDISDPEVIREFATIVRDQRRLDYLYVLTVADINATNPSLWNSWRSTLLRGLYVNAKRAFRHGIDNLEGREEIIRETRQAVSKKLSRRRLDHDRIESLWDKLGDNYFLRESAADILWHSFAILEAQQSEQAVVLIRETGSRFEGVTQLFLYGLDRPNLFATLVATLDQLCLDVHGARIYGSDDGHIIDSFFVLERDGKPVGDNPARIEEIHSALVAAMDGNAASASIVERRTPRRLKHFSSPTKTTLVRDPTGNFSVLEIVTPDRSGLLARIGQVFVAHGIKVHDARITTLGERVEDIFFISDEDDQPLSDPDTVDNFQQALKEALDTGRARKPSRP